jgi:hypothetical protein
MAIGDTVQDIMGTAATSRQPSSGVEEKIFGVVKPGNTDSVWIYNGSAGLEMITGPVITADDHSSTIQRFGGDYNMFMVITNSDYIRKEGSTDRIAVHGVQFNA